MTIKIEQVNTPTVRRVDNNTVTFQAIGQGSIKISRRQDGWRMRLEIWVNDCLWHSDEAGPACRHTFDRIMEIAMENDMAAMDSAKVKARAIASRLFVLPVS